MFENTSLANAAAHFLSNNMNGNGLMNNNMMHLDNQLNNNHLNANQIHPNQLNLDQLQNKTNLTNIIRTISNSGALPAANYQSYSNLNLNKLTNNHNLNNSNQNNSHNLTNNHNLNNYHQSVQNNLQNFSLQNGVHDNSLTFSAGLINQQQQLQNFHQQNLTSAMPQLLLNSNLTSSHLPLQPKQLPQNNIQNVLCNPKFNSTNHSTPTKYQQQLHQQNNLYHTPSNNSTSTFHHQNNHHQQHKSATGDQANSQLTQSHHFFNSIQTNPTANLQQQQLQQLYLQLNNQNNPNILNRNLINTVNHNLINRNILNVNTQSNDSNYYSNNLPLTPSINKSSSLLNNNHISASTPNRNEQQFNTSSFTFNSNGSGGSLSSNRSNSSGSDMMNMSNHLSNDNVEISGQLKNFKILKQIGNGQFSTVFRAVYIPTGQCVALKCIRILELEDMKTRLDCINEISLLQRLDHQNIIKFYTSFVEQNELYIVLELADCGDLAQFIKHFRKVKKTIPEKRIWSYFRQIADGLAHMFEHSILHRDLVSNRPNQRQKKLFTMSKHLIDNLKPSLLISVLYFCPFISTKEPPNVFITQNGVVKLGDLGLSKYYGANCKGNCCCSGPGYCTSNKEKNNNANIDTRAVLENHFNTILSQKNIKNSAQTSISLNNIVKACTQQARTNISDHKTTHYKFHKHLMQDEASSLIGTPFYMSKERLSENCKYDSQSDIWSLGCILYEMAALKSPFFGEKLNLVSLCQKIVSCNYPPLVDNYSVALRALVASCLDSNPKKRPDITLICEIAKFCSELNSKELQVAHLSSPLFKTLKVEEIMNQDKIKMNSLSPMKNNFYSMTLNSMNIRNKNYNDNSMTNNLINPNLNHLANCVPNNQMLVNNNMMNSFFSNNNNTTNDSNYNDLQSLDSDSFLKFWKCDSGEKNFI